MLKFINLKRLTAKTLIGILMVGGLITESSNKQALANNSCPGGNNGHGNNAPYTHYLDSGKLTIGHYDPSNPGNNRNRLISDLDDGIQSPNLHNNRPYDISYVGNDGSTSYNLTNAEATAIVNSHPDWEIRGNKDTSTLLKAGCSDIDGDGIDDSVEVGSNFNSPLDSDGDNIPDYLDSDSDGDGIADSIEGILDSDGDGVADYLDTVDDSVVNTTNTATSSSSDTITLTGTLRDFRGYRDKNGNVSSNGHEDFERKNNTDTNPSGQKFKYGLDKGITTDALGADQKPIYAGGSFSTTTKENFDQWYRDTPGVNQSMTYDIVLNKKAGSNIYSFDNQGQQFFPLNGLLLGNEGRNHNFHFTYEIHTEFTYQGGETFNFSGDDDVWVYINGEKVIDIGGVHGKTDARVELDSLGLTQGETYDLDFFFAERHVTQSNFKIETTIQLETASNPDDDDDNDGIPNNLEDFETEVDSDGDGTPDYLDEDSDNNGIPDSTEVGTVADPTDSDGDGTPNFQDDDDDGNGILDINEIGDDPTDPDNFDNTDLPDYQDTDDDNDGIKDVDDGMLDSPLDDDDTPNYQDSDSDGDGIPDSEETGEDSPLDDDSDPNHLDLDSDGDGIPDSEETGEDSPLDDDNDPNFLDLDSDGDGIPDKNEEMADSNDPDEATDVTDDDLEGDETTYNVDGEDDGDNYLDLDSDGDGFEDDIDPEPYIYTYAD